MARPALRRCFEAKGGEAPRAIHLSFEVDAMGKIVSASLDPSEEEGVEARCLMWALRNIRLQRDPGSGQASVEGFAVRL
jgi:hypothetical protein